MPVCNITKSIQAVIAYSVLQIIFFFSRAEEVKTDDTETTEEVYYFQIHVKLGSLLSSVCVSARDTGRCWYTLTSSDFISVLKNKNKEDFICSHPSENERK